MGDSVEQWRATIGQWSGGRPRNCVILQHHIAQTSNHIGYKHIRFLVLVSLLVIGCVELNPGPNHEHSAPTESAGALPKFHRRPGTTGLHGQLYEIKMAAFLFARGLNRTEEFRLASNVDGAGAFDDLVFRYRLRESDVWKTCLVQLKHRKSGGTIQRSSLTQMSGDFSLLKYFQSYCEIKNIAATDGNLEEFGNFGEFEFVIYTNQKMGGNCLLQGGDSDPLSILSSGSDCGKYIAFDKTNDTDIFGFFEELSGYQKLITELDSLLKRGTSVHKDIILKIEEFKSSVSNRVILWKLNKLKSILNVDCVTSMINEVSDFDFTLFEEFLSKVKIFQNQSNEVSLKGLIEKVLQEACKASPSVANFIYTKFEKEIFNWCQISGNAIWLDENSDLWQAVQNYIISEIKEISKPEIQEIAGCGVRFNEQHVQKLSDAIEQSTVLNIFTNTKLRILQKLKISQALNILGYKNPLFIRINSLTNLRKEINKLWPSKWSDVLVLNCDCDGNVAHTVLDIFQQSADCEQGLGIFVDNTVELLVDILQKYQQKVILISPRQRALVIHPKLRNIYNYFEDNCDILDLDEKSQKQILERPVNFQGTNVALSTLVGTDPPDRMKVLLDSDVISILLSNEHELSVGRQLDDHCKYYVPRVLKHQVYLKEDIFKRTDCSVTFAVSGLHAEELKKHLPVGQKICEFVYNERERIHSFKIVSDFSKTGLNAECGAMKTHQKVLQEKKSDGFRYNIFGNKSTEIKVSEGSHINSFSTVAKFSKYCLNTKLVNMKAYNEAGENIKPEEVRYIILGNNNPDSEFRELKKLCGNVHWIHVEDGSILWRDTNGNIDTIRRYIDNTKCEKYDVKCLVEHNDRTMLLVADPGMGKSTFLSYMAHEIKKWNPPIWVLRINLIEHTKELEDIEFEQECIDKCKEFLWSAAHSPEQEGWKVTKEIFLQALEQTEQMVIILDGYDELSPESSRKVEMLIGSIRDETTSKIWISSRLSYRQHLENIVGKFAFTLQPFTKENQVKFLVQYWSEVTGISNQENLQEFAERLISLCSQNFSDKDEEFTDIPLQTMMLGEAFVNEVNEYCCSEEFNLPEKFNLLYLFKKFTEKKFNIYFIERMGTSKSEVESGKKYALETHMVSALLYLFSPNEVISLFGTRNAKSLTDTQIFLLGDMAIKLGIIRDCTDGKPNFIHHCFAEYFAAKWFTDNFKNCKEFISNILLKSTSRRIRNIFDRMHAEDSEIHESVLNNDIDAIKVFLENKTDINTVDKGGRTALHLAASYNSPCIEELLSFPGIDANKLDAVLEWTPLRYAERTKSWMAMDILLQNGANPDDIVLTRHNAKAQKWGQAACWECASKGRIKLLEFMLTCGIQVNASVEVPENLHEKRTLLHRASYCGQVEVVRLLVDRGADINIRDVNNNTALHLAAIAGNVDIIKLLLDKGMSVNLTATDEITPLHVSAQFGHLEATKTLVERGADINIRDANKNTALHLAAVVGNVDIIKLLLDKGISVNLTNTNEFTPLHISAQFGHLEATKTLVERGADINFRDVNNNTALHLAAVEGNVDIINLLLDKGISVNLTNTDEFTPLHVSAQFGHLETTKTLVERGADVNIRDANNNTALHLAAVAGNVDIIKLLLDKGISVNLTNTNEFTPLHISARFGHLEATKTLVERGADINFRDVNNNTALHLAAVAGNVDIIKLLLDKGISVNLTNTDEFTPLHFSAQFGHLEATKTLVEKGADISKSNRNDNTPLSLATREGHLEVCLYLTQIGADNNIQEA